MKFWLVLNSILIQMLVTAQDQPVENDKDKFLSEQKSKMNSIECFTDSIDKRWWTKKNSIKENIILAGNDQKFNEIGF